MAYKVDPLTNDLAVVNINGVKLNTSAPTSLNAREGVFYLDGDYIKAKWATNAIGAADFSGAGSDDLTYSGTYTGTESNRVVYCEITATGTPDTFKICDSEGTTIRSGVSCSTSYTALVDGVTAKYTSASGHTEGDKWYSTIAALKTGNVSSGA